MVIKTTRGNLINTKNQDSFKGISMRLKGDNFLPYFQPRKDLCLPTALKVMYDGVKQAHNLGLSIGVSNLTKICDYIEGLGTVVELPILVSRLDKMVNPIGYKAFSGSGNQIDVAYLRTIIENNECSAPVITISGSLYFGERDKRYKVVDPIPEDKDYFHTIVITDIDEERDKIELFDPWAKPSEKITNKEDYKQTLNRVNLLKYWERSGKEAIWIKKIGERRKQKGMLLQSQLMQKDGKNG